MGDDGGARAGERGPVLVLYVDDLDEVLAGLADLGVAPHVPASREGTAGDRYAHVHDPEGNELILVELPEARGANDGTA